MIAGRLELFNRISDIIGLIRQIVLAGDRNNGIDTLIDDSTLNQLSDVDNLNNLRISLTNVERIALFNRILDNIRLVGRILLSYDRNNRIINLIINLRLNQLSRDVDSLSNFRESITNAGIIKFFNRLLGNTGLLGGNLLTDGVGHTPLLGGSLLTGDLGNTRLLGDNLLDGDEIVDVLNDDPIRNSIDININQRINVDDRNTYDDRVLY